MLRSNPPARASIHPLFCGPRSSIGSCQRRFYSSSDNSRIYYYNPFHLFNHNHQKRDSVIEMVLILGIFLFIIIRYMDKSDQYDGSIAEQQKIVGIAVHQEPKQDKNKKVKFATVNQIKNWERMTEIQNKKLIDKNPTLFDTYDLPNNNIHFIATQSQQYFLVSNKKEQADDIISKGDKKWSIKIDHSNVRKQFIFKLELTQMKRNRIFTIQSQKADGKKAGGFRYTLKMGDGTLALRVLVQLQGQFKIWKEMEIPSLQDPIILQIHCFNNQQTDIKINDFVFHLILKMPYHRETYYSLTHDNCVQITKMEIRTIAEQRQFGESETNCSNECQLI